MAYTWPDFVLPPINLWNVPWQRLERRPAPSRPPVRKRAGVARTREVMAVLLRGR